MTEYKMSAECSSPGNRQDIKDICFVRNGRGTTFMLHLSRAASRYASQYSIRKKADENIEAGSFLH